MRDIRVASVQFQHRAGDKRYNLSVIRQYTKQAAAQGAEIIVFPEMCITGYWHVSRLSREEIAALAEPVPDGPASRDLLQLAEEFGISIGAGLIECKLAVNTLLQ